MFEVTGPRAFVYVRQTLLSSGASHHVCVCVNRLTT